jgi:hypothetical protein
MLNKANGLVEKWTSSLANDGADSSYLTSKSLSSEVFYFNFYFRFSAFILCF